MVAATRTQGLTVLVLRNCDAARCRCEPERSSTSQSKQGTAISADQMQPGDLIFYGSGRGINHVAMYIGDGKVVHASTERTGIKTSPWNYRTPVKIVTCWVKNEFTKHLH